MSYLFSIATCSKTYSNHIAEEKTVKYKVSLETQYLVPVDMNLKHGFHESFIFGIVYLSKLKANIKNM